MSTNNVWARKCNECGNLQLDTEPVNAPTDAYLNRKCKKCKSEALDYGNSGYHIESGKIVRNPVDPEEE